MHFLLDHNQSRRLQRLLAAQGHDVVHVFDLGGAMLPDDQVLALAEQHARILITADTDFGLLVLLNAGTQPSVILMRDGLDEQPDVLAQLMLKHHDQIAAACRDGAFITLTASRIRFRSLPFHRPA